MKLAILLSALSIAVTAQAGKILSSSSETQGLKTKTAAAVDTETVYFVEYTEICVCPATTPVVSAITTVTCCESCAPVPITATTQYVTSCTTSYKPTTTVCPTQGVYKCGDNFVPCHNPPCTIQYNAPCPTCYACAYNDCWAPGAMGNSKPKHIEVIEYFGDVHVGSWNENWFCKTWDEVVTKTKYFTQPTIFIENNITINITAVPTIVTYTATSTYTTTSTTTVIASENPISRGPTAAPSSVAVPASSDVSSVPSAQPSSGRGINISFVLKSGSHAGYPVIISDTKLAYADSLSDTSQILRLNQGQLFDLSGDIVYISEADLTAYGRSNLYFTQADQVPSDRLTSVFSTDSNGDLVVVVHGLQLMAIICGDDGFILFGAEAGSCEAVELGPYAVPNSSGVSTPYPSTVPASSAGSATPSDVPSSVPSAGPSVTPSDAPSSAASVAPSDAPSYAPSSAAPSDSPSSAAPSDVPSTVPSTAPSVTPSDAPSSAASVVPSDAPSYAPSSVAQSDFPSSAASVTPSDNIPASSANPSVIPSAAPTYDHYGTVISPYGTDAVVIDQGHGVSGTDHALIQINAYDQFDNGFPGAKFIPSCASDNDECEFSLILGGPAVTEGYTDSNGVLQFFLSAMKAGNTTFTLAGPSGVMPSVKLVVTPIIDCTATTVLLNEEKQLDTLILGVDRPTLDTTTYDLNGDPMSGNVITYVYTLIGALQKRGIQQVATTDTDGVATYLNAGDVTIPGVYTWTATPTSCSDSSIYPQFTFNYGIDCAGSKVTLSSTMLPKTDTLTVTGQYITSDPDAQIQGSNININLAGQPNQVFLNTDGTFEASYPYNVSYGDLMLFSVDFPHAYPICNGKESLTIVWTDPAPYCGGDTTLVLSSNTPSDVDGVGTVGAVITVTDINGNRLSLVPYSISATMRAFSFGGTTDDEGRGTFLIPNGNYGAHNDPLQITVGTQANQCVFLYNDLTWTT